MIRYDTIVIGAGLSGLFTACQLAEAGQKTLVVSAGIGAVLLSSGCIDVLGFHPADSKTPVQNPGQQLDAFIADSPGHPYALVGKEALQRGLNAFLQLTAKAGLPYQGDLNRNWLFPGPLGAIHPACLAPASFVNGDLHQQGDILFVGFKELKDFYPALTSQNLNAQQLGVKSRAVTLDLPEPVAGKVNITAIELAREMDQPEFRRKIVQAVKPHLQTAARVGFPAVLGLTQVTQVLADLQAQLGVPVFEVSLLPPSVPGRRLFEVLRDILRQSRTEVIIGGKVIGGTIDNGKVTSVSIEAASRPKPLYADNFVMATGGMFGGGLQADLTGEIREAIFDLPIQGDQDRHHWFAGGFLAPEGQPVTKFGVKANALLNPVNGAAVPLASNLYLAGAAVAGYNWIYGRTGNGVALATSAAIVSHLLK